MPEDPQVSPVGDTVAKVDDAVAVGENLGFQHRWWRFERILWSFFLLILLADVSGLLGRGPLAKVQRQTSDGVLKVKYERIERSNTPSIMTVIPGAAAIQGGQLHLFISDSLVDQLGTQRVVPQPLSSTVGDGGITYVFQTGAPPMMIQLALQPSFVGIHTFTVRVSGASGVQARIAVLP